jgi:hypothetical protein
MPFDPYDPYYPLSPEEEDEQQRAARGSLAPPLPSGTLASVAPVIGGDPLFQAPPPVRPVETIPTTDFRPSRDMMSATDDAPVPAQQQEMAPPPHPRMPVNVTDRVGAQPMRDDQRYQTDHMGRLKAGWENFKVGPPLQPVGGTPGERAGEALGGLAGRFLSGVIRPSVVGENRYSRDLNKWQAAQEAASKAATEEAQRAHLLSEATHRDPYTGEVDPVYRSLIENRASQQQARQKTADAAMLRAQSAVGRLKVQTQGNLLRAMETGVFKPSEDEAKELSSAGLEWVGKQGANGVSLVKHRGVDAYGRPVESYYYFDKQAKQIRPVMSGGEVIENPAMAPPAIGQPAAPQNQAPGPPVATSQPSQPFTLPGTPGKGQGPYGDFASPEQALAKLSGYRSQWESTFRAWQQAQQNLDDMKKRGNDQIQAASSSDRDRLTDWWTRELDRAQGDVNKHEESLSKIEADVHGKYDEMPGLVTWREGLHGGWVHNPKALAGRPAYPMPGGEATRKTGRIPGVKTGPGTMFPR